jgi:hypothetical protein
MEWKTLLAYMTGTVDQELLVRNELSRGGEPHFANPGVSGLEGSRMRVRGGAIAQRVHLIVLAAR